MDGTLCVVDVMPFLYRGHFVFLKNPRRTTSGINTSSISLLASSLATLLADPTNTHIALAFDPEGPTFRHQLDPNYKAQRQKTPEDILDAVPQALQLAQALNIPALRIPGFEADDILGTLATLAAQNGLPCRLVTPDKDAAQLVDPNTTLVRPGQKDDLAQLDLPAVLAHWQLESPAQMIDYLALVGDASDNIPGIKGIGEKTAHTLLQQYHTLETILDQAPNLKGKLAEKVLQGRADALRSKTLATIRRDVPLNLTLDDLRRKEPHLEPLKTFLQHYELHQTARRLLPPGHTLQPQQPTFKTLADTPHFYTCVRTEAQLQTLLKTLQKSPLIAFDTETTGLDPHHDTIVGCSFATAPGQAWYIPLNTPPAQPPLRQPDLFDQPSDEPDQAPSPNQTLSRFLPIFQDPTKTLVGHNLKFDLSVLAHYGITVACNLHDTLLEHYVLDAAARHSLDDVARAELSYAPIPIGQLLGGNGKEHPATTMDRLSPEEICDYAAEDADVALRLEQTLRPRCRKAGLESALERSEEPLIRVLIDMEREGVTLDLPTLRRCGNELQGELDALGLRIAELAGHTFNFASPKQLGEVLFDELKLDPHAKKTALGHYSTSEEVLLGLKGRHPIVDAVLDYRACAKLKNTYVDKLPLCINPATGRVHTTFSQALTETGRLSSSEPNLQNIPIRTARGQRIREAFVPSSPDRVLMAADYSQVELRIMAALSGDPAMLEAFANGVDIHAQTAAKVYGVSLEAVTREMRAQCKQVNFGIIYGISPFGLSRRLGIPIGEAKRLIEGYFATYPRVKECMERMVAEASERGYATTLLGRRRALPDILSRNATTRAAASRNAINTPIQGTAADVIKLAMVRIHREIKERGLAARLILQIHDELLFDVPQCEVQTLLPMVRSAMEGALPMAVPLEVSIGVGANWLEAH